MKVQLRKITDGSESLKKLLNAPLPLVKSYHLSRLGSKVQSELKQFGATYDAGIKKYGKEQNPGKEDYFIPQGTPEFKKFADEIESVKDTEVEIRNYQPVELTSSDLAGLQLSAFDISSIEPFVIFNLEEKPKEEGKVPEPDKKVGKKK